jgi:Cu+-exporting ATPase
MNKPTIIAFAVSAVLIGWAFMVVSPQSAGEEESPVVSTATTTADGTQLIDITAKGGYSPRIVIAKAGVPTLLRVRTSGTFDCSASIVIPKLSYQKFLQPSAVEEISITAEQAQGTLQGICSMGMYNFQVKFE